MTVDKPPLALWVQALSARVFGFHPLSILVPAGADGRGGGRARLRPRRAGGSAASAGFVAGLALATTPITVAISRHNNPDELLVLCSRGGAVVRGARARDRADAVAGAERRRASGLGFETKMARGAVRGARDRARLDVEPLGRPGAARSRRSVSCWPAASRWSSSAGAWPLLVTLTPAADRPWISGHV